MMAIVWYGSDESGRVLFVAPSRARSYGNCLVLLCETGSGKCAELAYDLLVKYLSSTCTNIAIPPVLPKASCTFLFCAMFACDCFQFNRSESPIGNVAKFRCPASL
jgi:hypothetical protein